MSIASFDGVYPAVWFDSAHHDGGTPDDVRFSCVFQKGENVTPPPFQRLRDAPLLLLPPLFDDPPPLPGAGLALGAGDDDRGAE